MEVLVFQIIGTQMVKQVQLHLNVYKQKSARFVVIRLKQKVIAGRNSHFVQTVEIKEE